MMFANVPRFHLENFGSCLQKSQVLGHLRTGHLQHPTVILILKYFNYNYYMLGTNKRAFSHEFLILAEDKFLKNYQCS